MEPSLHWKSFFLHCKSFSKNHSFLGGGKNKCLLKRIAFYMIFYIPMATQNNSRSDWLNKNDHDFLLSHRTATEWDSIKIVFEITVYRKNAFVISVSVREVADSSVGHHVLRCEAGHRHHSCVTWYSTLPTAPIGCGTEKQEEEGILSETMRAFVLHPYIMKSLTNGCELMTFF